MDNYTINECLICKQLKPLKNGICIDCKKKTPDNLGFFDWFNKTIKNKED